MRALLALLCVTAARAQEPAAAPRVVAHLADPLVAESSGVAASRRYPGVYWTHNDSGDGPVLYAFDRDGRNLGRWTVRGAQAVDWEDIAIGPGPLRGRWYLYAGDIGDNRRARREAVVYRVEEPAIGPPAACARGCVTAPAIAIRLRYPDGPHNAEALLVHPRSGDLYVITKAGGGDRETQVFVARAAGLGRQLVRLEYLASLDVPDALFRVLAGGITGGDIAPDGRHVVLCDYFRAYEAELAAGAAFDDIWRARFRMVPIGGGLQVEGIAYTADGSAVMATSEGRPCPVIEVWGTLPAAQPR